MLPFPFTLNWMDLLSFIIIVLAAGAAIVGLIRRVYDRWSSGQGQLSFRKAA